MQDRHDSDFLTWTLAGAAVLIMTVAVRINAGEPAAPGPAVHDPGGQEPHPVSHPQRDSQRADHPPGSTAARA